MEYNMEYTMENVKKLPLVKIGDGVQESLHNLNTLLWCCGKITRGFFARLVKEEGVLKANEICGGKYAETLKELSKISKNGSGFIKETENFLYRLAGLKNLGVEDFYLSESHILPEAYIERMENVERGILPYEVMMRIYNTLSGIAKEGIVKGNQTVKGVWQDKNAKMFVNETNEIAQQAVKVTQNFLKEFKTYNYENKIQNSNNQTPNILTANANYYSDLFLNTPIEYDVKDVKFLRPIDKVCDKTGKITKSLKESLDNYCFWFEVGSEVIKECFGPDEAKRIIQQPYNKLNAILDKFTELDGKTNKFFDHINKIIFKNSDVSDVKEGVEYLMSVPKDEVIDKLDSKIGSFRRRNIGVRISNEELVTAWADSNAEKFINTSNRISQLIYDSNKEFLTTVKEVILSERIMKDYKEQNTSKNNEGR